VGRVPRLDRRPGVGERLARTIDVALDDRHRANVTRPSG
jgi:hypothetical protein